MKTKLNIHLKVAHTYLYYNRLSKPSCELVVIVCLTFCLHKSGFWFKFQFSM